MNIHNRNLNWWVPDVFHLVLTDSSTSGTQQASGTLFAALMQQEIGFFDTTQIGELTSRMTQDCQQVVEQAYLNVNLGMKKKFGCWHLFH